LTAAQTLDAWTIHARIEGAANWIALRNLALHLDGTSENETLKGLPGWVIDAFNDRLRIKMSEPVIGNPIEWASLSDNERYDVASIHAAISSGNPTGAMSPAQHLAVLTPRFKAPEFDNLPEWARQGLRRLLTEVLPPATTMPAISVSSSSAPSTSSIEQRASRVVDEDTDEQVKDNSWTETEPHSDDDYDPFNEPRTTAGADDEHGPYHKQEPFRIHLKTQAPFGYCAYPTTLVQSALFPGTKNNKGFYGATIDELARVESLSHSRIYARGLRFSMAHLELLTTVMDKARNGDVVRTSAKALLTAMQRGHSSADVEYVCGALKLLASTYVRIVFKPRNTHKRSQYAGAFIKTLDPGDPAMKLNTVITITLDPALGPFLGSRWAFIKIADRAGLRTKPMASWLHAAYAQHVDDSIAYSHERVQKLLGVSVDGKEFKRLLTNAVNALKTRKLIVDGSAADEKLRILPLPTPSKLNFIKKVGRPANASVLTAGAAPSSIASVVPPTVIPPPQNAPTPPLSRIPYWRRALRAWFSLLKNLSSPAVKRSDE
jgi:hypothetical protein